MELPVNFSPFRDTSFEPRFAVDFSYCAIDVISLGLSLCRSCKYATPESRFLANVRESEWLAVTTSDSFARRLANSEPFFSDLSQTDAASRVFKWLNELDYPPQPWFEGGESRGFTMFHVPWEQEPRAFYGYTIVQPKWFEVHK